MSHVPFNAAQWLVDRQVAAGAGSHPCFRCADRVYRYDEVCELVARFGGLLAGAGIGRGHRVLIALPDGIEAAVVTLATIRAGAVAVPLSPRLKARDYARILEDAAPDAIAVTSAFRDASASVVPDRRWLLATDAIPGWRSLPADLVSGTATAEPAPTSGTDVALMQYTSGSTGEPRGVVHRHAALRAATSGLIELLGVGSDDILLSASKMAFGYGLGNSVLVPMAAGASSVLSGAPAEPAVLATNLAVHRPTLFFAVPTVYAALLGSRDAPERFPLRAARAYVSSGERLGAHLGAGCMAAFGEALADVFGCTETLYSFAGNPPGRWTPGVIGAVFPGYEIDVRETEPGEGELWVRGPGVAAGYWRQPEKTAEAFDGAWVRTGDTVRILPDGRLEHLGRSDDIIKVHGLKVAPAEVEDALQSHPWVSECAVVGTTRDDGRSAMVAYVVPSEVADTGSPDVLSGFAARLLGAHKRPEIVRFVNALPLTPTGKTSRRLLWSAASAASAASSASTASSAAKTTGR